MFTDKQLTAAALAYVAARDVGGATEAAIKWATAYPQHFSELKQRIARALEAANAAELH